MMQINKITEVSQSIVNGNRRSLAQAITLIESTLQNDRILANKLLEHLLPHTGQSIRIGITGSPGVGKSTFIEAFGLKLINSGYRVAVLAIDPSSPATGGSILGDKTRMEELSKNDHAFIRPSPARGELGGIAARTRETILVCESAGFDIILIETVGVGQSEISVSRLCDIFALILAPSGGDDLQGIKKGIVELSDLIIVNKADGPLLPIAKTTASDYASAIKLVRPKHRELQTKIFTCSALEKEGIEAIQKFIVDFYNMAEASGKFKKRRETQLKSWIWDEVNKSLIQRLYSKKRTKILITKLENEVQNGETSPMEAAKKILNSLTP